MEREERLVFQRDHTIAADLEQARLSLLMMLDDESVLIHDGRGGRLGRLAPLWRRLLRLFIDLRPFLACQLPVQAGMESAPESQVIGRLVGVAEGQGVRAARTVFDRPFLVQGREPHRGVPVEPVVGRDQEVLRPGDLFGDEEASVEIGREEDRVRVLGS